jgi:hypothetical protein
MCPACMASAVLMAGGLMTSGGLAALLVKLSLFKQSKKRIASNNSTKKEK